MSNKLLIVAGLIIFVLAAGYLLLGNKTKGLYSTKVVPTKTPITKNENSKLPPTGVSIVINEQNNSGESGIATIGEVDGKVVVNLKLIGEPLNVSQPAHLHSGTCQKPGDIVFPLSNVVNGESKTTLTVNMDSFNQRLPLTLNVHKSEQELNIYVSCGQVSP